MLLSHQDTNQMTKEKHRHKDILLKPSPKRTESTVRYPCSKAALQDVQMLCVCMANCRHTCKAVAFLYTHAHKHTQYKHNCLCNIFLEMFT